MVGGGENIDQKIRTTVYLEKDAKRLVEDEVENLSKWVNEKIYTSLSCATESDVLEKKKELEGKIHELDVRLKEIQNVTKESRRGESLKNTALEELRHGFVYRVNDGRAREQNLDWIVSPKNIGRCKILGKTSEEALNELEAWYDGTSKSQEK